MRYFPHTKEDEKQMLDAIGIKSIDNLFHMIPENVFFDNTKNIPEFKTEWETDSIMSDLTRQMSPSGKYRVFAGAGSYNHYIPEHLKHLLSRSEFKTSYTPYQPEMSQGTLQASYEYATLICRYFGMEVSNASMYNGASSLAEAVLMAMRITDEKNIAFSSVIHPAYLEVTKTYVHPFNGKIISLAYKKNGRTDYSFLKKVKDLAAIVIQSPNFFGVMEDISEAASCANTRNIPLIVCFTEPLAYGIYKNPGDLGATIICGEGQSFGISQSFGGPGLGIFATCLKYVRNMPGRIVGKTVDMDKKPGFVLTLSTREQHIRRQKATSNICTNSNLNAIAAAIYLASAGPEGIYKLSKLNFDKTCYLKEKLSEAGIKIVFDAPGFNEFVVQFPDNFQEKYKKMLKKQIVAGICLEKYYPELDNHYLLCVTETIKKDDMDFLVKEVAS